VSGDGRWIVGNNRNTAELRPFIWEASMGMVPLDSFLTGIGVNLEGWRLWSVRTISADGTGIIGDGIYQGQDRAFLITIPTPSVASVLALTMLYGIRRRS
jgi:hypothetical protein